MSFQKPRHGLFFYGSAWIVLCFMFRTSLLKYVVLLWMIDRVFIFFPFQTVCCIWLKRTLALSCRWVSSVLFIWLTNKSRSLLKYSYHPIPVVFSQAKGAAIWDPEGNRYLDFLSAYSAVNQVEKDRVIILLCITL